MNETAIAASLLERRKRLDSRRRRLHKVKKQIVTGTDSGGALTAYFDGPSLVITDLEIGLSNQDVVDSFYFDNGHLFLVREIVKQYPFVDSRGEFDFTRPAVRSDSHIFFLPSGKVVLDKPLDPYVNRRQNPEAVVKDRLQMSKVLVVALHAHTKEVNLEHVIMGL